MLAAQHAHVAPQVDQRLGWTDVTRFAELGIPAVNYGPGISEIAHTPGEYVDAAPIVAAEQALRSCYPLTTANPPTYGRRSGMSWRWRATTFRKFHEIVQGEARPLPPIDNSMRRGAPAVPARCVGA
jgi:hypothetical protein